MTRLSWVCFYITIGFLVAFLAHFLEASTRL
jgi:hypothetical protein